MPPKAATAMRTADICGRSDRSCLDTGACFSQIFPDFGFFVFMMVRARSGRRSDARYAQVRRPRPPIARVSFEEKRFGGYAWDGLDAAAR